MIVSVSGFNCSGSGAVFDLLKEYGDVKCVESEVGIMYLPDGIMDLQYHINASASYLNGDAALYRYYNICKKLDISKRGRYGKAFLEATREYLNELIEIEWEGDSCFDGLRKTGADYCAWKIKSFISSVVYHFTKKSLAFNKRRMFLSYNNDLFWDYTNKYLNKVGAIFSENKEIVVFDQFISAYKPEYNSENINCIKTIVVDRDPRDMYTIGKVRPITNCYPADDVKKYVEWYRKCHQQDESTRGSSEKVLRIQFEDLVFKYDETIKIIEEFLGLKNHIYCKEIFKPEVSKNNTQIYKRYPQLQEDISYIENELSKELYSFTVECEQQGDWF